MKLTSKERRNIRKRLEKAAASLVGDKRTQCMGKWVALTGDMPFPTVQELYEWLKSTKDTLPQCPRCQIDGHIQHLTGWHNLFICYTCQSVFDDEETMLDLDSIAEKPKGKEQKMQTPAQQDTQQSQSPKRPLIVYQPQSQPHGQQLAKQPAGFKVGHDGTVYCTDSQAHGEITDGRCPDTVEAAVPAIHTTLSLFRKWIDLTLVYDTEWIALLTGKQDEQTGVYTIEDMYFPPQTATPGSVDVAEEFTPRAGTVGAVHSHVNMAVFFSSVDLAHSNWPVEIVVNRYGEYKAAVRHKLGCGRYAKSLTRLLSLPSVDDAKTELDAAFQSGAAFREERRKLNPAAPHPDAPSGYKMLAPAPAPYGTVSFYDQQTGVWGSRPYTPTNSAGYQYTKKGRKSRYRRIPDPPQTLFHPRSDHTNGNSMGNCVNCDHRKSVHHGDGCTFIEGSKRCPCAWVYGYPTQGQLSTWQLQQAMERERRRVQAEAADTKDAPPAPEYSSYPEPTDEPTTTDVVVSPTEPAVSHTSPSDAEIEEQARVAAIALSQQRESGPQAEMGEAEGDDDDDNDFYLRFAGIIT